MSKVDSAKDLVRRLKHDPDEASVGLLLKTYGPRLFGAAMGLCGNTTDAEDLVIMTLQKAVHNIAGFHEQSSLFTWLYGILYNQHLMLRRKYARSRMIYVDQLPETADESVAHPLEDIAASERAKELLAAIDQLPETMQDVVRLRYFGEMKIADIAKNLKIPVGTVKSRLFNALSQLKSFLSTTSN